jgi:hypothetical protein
MPLITAHYPVQWSTVLTSTSFHVQTSARLLSNSRIDRADLKRGHHDGTLATAALTSRQHAGSASKIVCCCPDAFEDSQSWGETGTIPLTGMTYHVTLFIQNTFLSRIVPGELVEPPHCEQHHTVL